MVNFPFFILPFLLFFSKVSEAIGLYICLFLYPLILVINYRIQIPKYVIQIANILFILFACFILSNFLNLLFPNSLMPKGFYIRPNIELKLFKSLLPGSYMGVALCLYAVYYMTYLYGTFRKKTLNTYSQLYPSHLKPLQNFLKGMLYCSIIFCVLFVIEYFTKIDYHILIYQFKIEPDIRFSTLDYKRPEGLLGNALTLASMSLACFTFLYVYFCHCIFIQENDSNLPFIKNKLHLSLYTLIPSTFFLIILCFTLARTVIFLAILVIIFAPIILMPTNKIKKILPLIFVFIFLILLLGYYLNFYIRLLNPLKNMSKNPIEYLGNRLIFSKIYLKMFLDAPWIGNGFYWVLHGLRDQYYIILGYAHLNERDFHAHNVYTEILASGGLMCASLISYGVWKLQKIFKTYFMCKAKKNYTIWIAFTWAFVVNLGHAFTQDNFLERPTTYVYFFLIFIIFWEVMLNSQYKHQSTDETK